MIMIMDNVDDILEALEAQLCTMLVNSERLNDIEMMTSVAMKANSPQTLLAHLDIVAETLEGKNSHLLELLDEQGISLKKLAEIAEKVHGVLAERLNDDTLKARISEACFKILYPELYTKIVDMADYDASRIWLEQQAQDLYAEVLKYVNNVEMEWRVKSIGSAWIKSNRNAEQLTSLHDLYGIRFIVPNIEDCYTVVSCLLESRNFDKYHYRDYVAKAKKSGYSSLHIVITAKDSKSIVRKIEVQVRTVDMHNEAKFGKAAHWAYKSSVEGEPKWLSDVLAGTNLPDKIRVFTPAGQVAVLPNSSCVIDFAYWVHSNVGATCVGASVNGRTVPLDTVLADGDSVQIRVGKRDGPNKDWLHWVVSPHAKLKIRRQLRDMGIAIKSKEIKQQGQKHVGELLQKKTIIDKEQATSQIVSSDEFEGNFHAGSAAVKAQAKVRVIGGKDILCRIGLCCAKTLTVGDNIVGRGLKDGTFTVHKQNCINVVNANNVVDAYWM